MNIIAGGKSWIYQYEGNKIEIKATLGNLELYINDEVQATTKGKALFQVSSDIHLSAKLPSDEDVLAIKRAKFMKEEMLLFVGHMLTPQ